MRRHVSISAAVLEPKHGRSKNPLRRHLPVMFPLKLAASPYPPPIARLAAELSNDPVARAHSLDEPGDKGLLSSGTLGHLRMHAGMKWGT